MAEPNQPPNEENLQAPEKLVEAMNRLHKERIFVPPGVDLAVLRGARGHLRRRERPQSRWKPRLSWAAVAACLALAVWLGERFGNSNRTLPFAREDINHDGRVDVLDAFALARQIETGGTLDPRWDINGDGRIDRADVNAIATRAVSLARVGPEPRRSAHLRPDRADTITIRSTQVRAPFGVRRQSVAATALWVRTEPQWKHTTQGRYRIQSGVALRFPPHSKVLTTTICGARLCEPQHVKSDRRAGFVKTPGGRQSSCGSQTRAPFRGDRS